MIAQIVAQTVMTSLHCDVDIAGTGKEAIEIFEAGKYQLIFADLGLPDISGNDVISQFRKKEEGTLYRAPIIALTAHITEEIKEECAKAGTDEVCYKPLAKPEQGTAYS